jgi:hypothetical protein
MKHRDPSSDNENPDNKKKNAGNKKLGDKIGPAKKHEGETDKRKEQADEKDATRSDDKKPR